MNTWLQHQESDVSNVNTKQRVSMNVVQVMTKEQLYDLFQQILNIKKFEHQLLYNAMQVYIIDVRNDNFSLFHKVF